MPFVHENVKVELFPGTPSPIVYLSENDVGDTVVFELVYKGQPVNIPSGSVVKFKGTKKDGLGFTVDSSNVSDNVVSFIVSEDMTSCSGVVEAEISITLSNNKHGTCNVVLIIEKNPHSDGTQDGSYPQIVSEMRQLVEQIEGDAETASDAADTAVAAKNSALEIQQDVHQYTVSAIDDWLDEHPEATTTVQDGSLTYKKLVTGTLGFVTPQMYGAVGDNVADDTDAFESMLNSGAMYIFIPKGNYKISQPLTLYKKHIVGAGYDATYLYFNDCNGLIVDREVTIKDFTITQTNQYNHYGINFKNTRDGDTVTQILIDNVIVNYFSVGMRAVESAVWSSSFKNMRIRGNTTMLYFDSYDESLSASMFGLTFDRVGGNSVNGGDVYYLRGVSAIFLNCNVATNFIECIYIANSHIHFDTCFFETDSTELTDNGALMQLSDNIMFTNCRFVHNFRTAGNNYIVKAINVSSGVKWCFINCHTVAYTGSQLKAFMHPSSILGAPKYGCVLAYNNSFDFSNLYNSVKPYVDEDGNGIILYSGAGNVDKTKLVQGRLYMYRYDSVNFKPVLFDGTNIIDLSGTIME